MAAVETIEMAPVSSRPVVQVVAAANPNPSTSLKWIMVAVHAAYLIWIVACVVEREFLGKHTLIQAYLGNVMAWISTIFHEFQVNEGSIAIYTLLFIYFLVNLAEMEAFRKERITLLWVFFVFEMLRILITIWFNQWLVILFKLSYIVIYAAAASKITKLKTQTARFYTVGV